MGPRGRAARTVQRAMRRWRRLRPVNACDPISQEPLKEIACVFRIVNPDGSVHGFDAERLANYFDATGDFSNPLTRRVLHDAEVARLDRCTDDQLLRRRRALEQRRQRLIQRDSLVEYSLGRLRQDGRELCEYLRLWPEVVEDLSQFMTDLEAVYLAAWLETLYHLVLALRDEPPLSRRTILERARACLVESAAAALAENPPTELAPGPASARLLQLMLGEIRRFAEEVAVPEACRMVGRPVDWPLPEEVREAVLAAAQHVDLAQGASVPASQEVDDDSGSVSSFESSDASSSSSSRSGDWEDDPIRIDLYSVRNGAQNPRRPDPQPHRMSLLRRYDRIRRSSTAARAVAL